MNELKTLKDCGLDVGTHLVIQTEAVKWVKYSDKIANDPESPQDELRDFWIKRFNLKEEDLK